MKIISVNLDEIQVKGFSLLEKSGIITSRSEGVRMAIRDFLSLRFAQGKIEAPARDDDDSKRAMTRLIRKFVDGGVHD